MVTYIVITRSAKCQFQLFWTFPSRNSQTQYSASANPHKSAQKLVEHSNEGSCYRSPNGAVPVAAGLRYTKCFASVMAVQMVARERKCRSSRPEFIDTLRFKVDGGPDGQRDATSRTSCVSRYRNHRVPRISIPAAQRCSCAAEVSMIARLMGPEWRYHSQYEIN